MGDNEDKIQQLLLFILLKFADFNKANSDGNNLPIDVWVLNNTPGLINKFVRELFENGSIPNYTPDGINWYVCVSAGAVNDLEDLFMKGDNVMVDDLSKYSEFLVVMS